MKVGDSSATRLSSRDPWAFRPSFAGGLVLSHITGSFFRLLHPSVIHAFPPFPIGLLKYKTTLLHLRTRYPGRPLQPSSPAVTEGTTYHVPARTLLGTSIQHHACQEYIFRCKNATVLSANQFHIFQVIQTLHLVYAKRPALQEAGLSCCR